MDKQPLLADRFIADVGRWPAALKLKGQARHHAEKLASDYRVIMRKAHRFVLDNDFVRFASEVSTTTKAEKLLYRLQYATLPYETTWIEFNARLKVEIIRAIHRPEDDFTDLHEVPARMGLLLHRIDQSKWLCEIVPEALEMQDMPIIPNLVAYFVSCVEHDFGLDGRIHGCDPFDNKKRAARTQATNIFGDMAPETMKLAKASLWGYGDEKSQDILDGKRNIGLRLGLPKFLERHGSPGFSRSFDLVYDKFKQGTVTASVSEVASQLEEVSDLLTIEMREFTGFMRWAVTVLSMLNEVPVRANYTKPAGEYRTRMGARPYLDYHVVTLKVPKTRPVPYIERKLSNVERRHRAHDVIQHWRTYLPDAPYCKREEHQWEYDWNEGYRLCGTCMAFSRLIHEHVRGDPSLGWVRKDYFVKKDKQTE